MNTLLDGFDVSIVLVCLVTRTSIFADTQDTRFCREEVGDAGHRLVSDREMLAVPRS